MRSSPSLLCGIRRRAFDSLNRLINFNKKIFNSISRRKRYKSVYLNLFFSNIPSFLFLTGLCAEAGA